MLAVLGSLGSLEMRPPFEPAGPADEEEISGDDEGHLLAGFPADFVDDVAEELAEAFGVDAEDAADLEKLCNQMCRMRERRSWSLRPNTPC